MLFQRTAQTSGRIEPKHILLYTYILLFYRESQYKAYILQSDILVKNTCMEPLELGQ